MMHRQVPGLICDDDDMFRDSRSNEAGRTGGRNAISSEAEGEGARGRCMAQTSWVRYRAFVPSGEEADGNERKQTAAMARGVELEGGRADGHGGSQRGRVVGGVGGWDRWRASWWLTGVKRALGRAMPHLGRERSTPKPRGRFPIGRDGWVYFSHAASARAKPDSFCPTAPIHAVQTAADSWEIYPGMWRKVKPFCRAFLGPQTLYRGR
ncbi:hypothetical protein BU16DRAFT_330949 [Lophium mytilinum]|uniref:Uncharacterized protein n=1 Tax=Lophium mytilinum TaxID=390894 RepID=A0A6A6R0T7_9PEZI|nr:hypothetical protein BU16DRAFT_330949 [Lophium mytilinum]